MGETIKKINLNYKKNFNITSDNSATNSFDNTIEDIGEFFEENVSKPFNDFINTTQSMETIKGKILSNYGMYSYGVAKGFVEENINVILNIELAEAIIGNKISSETVSKLVDFAFDAGNGAIMPKAWLEFGEGAFAATAEGFNFMSLASENFNLIASAGARTNVIINGFFSSIDGAKLWLKYNDSGDDGSNHVGEIVGRVTGETVGGAGGFAAGAVLGASASAAITGAACGSVVPGIGTAAGLITGAIVGAVGSTILGNAGATVGSYADGNNGEILPL